MSYTVNEVLTFVTENDVKFIKLAFCDMFGNQKNIAIVPHELPRAFETGISFDASAVKGFMNIEESDLFLYPDPSTLVILPWRPQQGRVIRLFCNIKHPNGEPFEGDGRSILTRAAQRAHGMGYECTIGTECEFYLLEVDERGMPTKIPHDYAGYCDTAPLDKGENVRREICLTLEKMGITPESSHHEQGHGQNEIDFRYSSALQSADNLTTFKTVVKTIAARNGLFASFMPKPFIGQSGSGLHINLSLFKDQVNIFKTGEMQHSLEAEAFIAGIMDKISDITAFLNPLTNSYQRFGNFEAPKYITWSHQNRSQLIRIPAAKGNYARMELRSPDPACNPYLSFALLIHAGLDGIEKKKKLVSSTDINLYTADKEILETLQCLPKNLLEAIEKMQKSEFVQDILPITTINKYSSAKRLEWEAYQNASDKEMIETKMYLNSI